MKPTHAPATDEAPQGIFEPDILLPSQHADRIGGRRILDGERRLMVAILEDAIDVYRKQAAARETRKRHLFEDAEAWIDDPNPAWIFSFENICAVLDLDPSYIRRGLHDWKREARARAAAGGAQVVRLDTRPATPPAMRRASGDHA
jgi:hypothetical protein